MRRSGTGNRLQLGSDRLRAHSSIELMTTLHFNDLHGEERTGQPRTASRSYEPEVRQSSVSRREF